MLFELFYHMNTLVLIGSKNPVKIKAVQSVFNSFFPNPIFEFHSYDSPSQVSPQPWGNEETIQGAMNRAKNVKSLYLDECKNSNHKITPHIFCVGIEAGLIPIPYSLSGYFDVQFCVIIDENGHISLGSGSGWEYPKSIITELKKDPNLEIGTIMGRLGNDPDVKNKNGAIGYYTHNRITRPILTEQCVQMALIPFLNTNLYYSDN